MTNTFEGCAFGVGRRGGVVLGDHVVCDGFFEGTLGRIQSHSHRDHLNDFNISKGRHTIYTSLPTRSILVAELNADLKYRTTKFVGQELNSNFECGNTEIELLDSNHMLGAVQIVCKRDDGVTTAYSGDFGWPLAEIPKVDALILDATNGSPNTPRAFDKSVIDDQFIDVVRAGLRTGNVHLKAHRGTLQVITSIIRPEFECPIICSDELMIQMEVYSDHNYSLEPLIPESRMSELPELGVGERYIRLYGPGEQNIFGISEGTKIEVSAHWAGLDSPVRQTGTSSYVIALSMHADFDQTMEYVALTGASYVVTDSSRSGYAGFLSREINELLGVRSVQSVPFKGSEY